MQQAGKYRKRYDNFDLYYVCVVGTGRKTGLYLYLSDQLAMNKNGSNAQTTKIPTSLTCVYSHTCLQTGILYLFYIFLFVVNEYNYLQS